MNLVIFVHSSDLILPGKMGISVIQAIVISRLLDIENRRIGEGYYWHIRISELYYKKEYTLEEKEESDKEFD